MITRLKDSHRQEWQAAQVKESIIAANVRTIPAGHGWNWLMVSPKLKRRNTGALSTTLLRLYRLLDECDGWLVTSINLYTGEDTEYCQLKLEVHRIGKDGKLIKYEGPPKLPTEPILLKVPLEDWEDIAAKQRELLGREVYPYCPLAYADHKPNEYAQFWLWALDANLPLNLTEGAKKAGALLSLGHCAIALPGIYSGYRQQKDEHGNKIGLPRLVPQLEPFATPGREINFIFDHDTKPKTVKDVRKATERTGKLLTYKGCTVKVVQWPDNIKGVDDLVAAKGADYFDFVYEQRISLDEFITQSYTALQPNLTINERFIPLELPIPSDAQLIGLESPYETGKTEFIARKIEPLLARGEKVLVIGHREQLMQDLARRFGTEYRTELKESSLGGMLGYALCIDSLHPKANPPFKASQWEGATVVIDEVEQVIWHLLNSETCQQNRVRILTSLRELLATTVATGGKIYIGDNDLSAISVRYIERLIGFPIKTYIVKNTYQKENKRKCYLFKGNTPEQLITNLQKAIAQGEKVIVFTDGQKHKSQWGTRNLEYHLKKKFPHLKILRIDRDSVANPKHDAYGIISQLNEKLPLYDIVICSPTLETGVSIDVKHFNAVYAISHGVQTVDAVGQALERVRDDVPRFIWVANYSRNRIGRGETELKALLSTTHRLTETNIKLLQKAGITEFNDLEPIEKDCNYSPSLTAWGQRACIINCQNKNFKENLKKKLQSRYEIIELDLVADVIASAISDVIASAISDAISGAISDAISDAIASAISEGASQICTLAALRGVETLALSLLWVMFLQKRDAPISDDKTPDEIMEDMLKIKDEIAQVKAEVKESRDENYTQHRQRVSKTKNPPNSEYEELKKKRSLTDEEQYQEQKGKLCRRYMTEDISPDLIKLDDDNIYPKLRLHYFLTIGNCFLVERDKKRLRKHKEDGDGKMFKPDVNKSQLITTVETLKIIGIERFLDPNAEFTSESLKEWFEQLNNPLTVWQIKAILGVSINQKDTPVAAAQRLLNLLGLNLTFDRWQRFNGKAKRVYKGCQVDPERLAIFSRWFAHDDEETLRSVTPS